MTDSLAQTDVPPRAPPGNLLVLAVLAMLGGLAAGLLGALFRLALAAADRLRGQSIVWMHGWSLGGFTLLLVLIAFCAALAAWMVRRFAPYAAGSGIPQVEAELSRELTPPSASLIPVKFAGGVLAIGAGLALGREGPSIQMGGSIAYHIGRWCRRNWADCRVLLAAGAGAGLATAFNAPIAGAVFVLEELVKRFEPRIAIAALAASAAAIWVERLILGNQPDFTVQALAAPSFSHEPLYLLLGIVAGFAGVFYNRTLLWGLRTSDRFAAWPIELRAALVGAAIAVVAWFAPAMVGGGDPLTQRALAGVGALALLPGIYLLRLGMISCSYGAQTPGGLFAPLLVLGAVLGLWIGKLCALALPGMGIEPVGFALVAMAALFTAIVRAPVTGIVLVTEMTGNVSMLLPMMVACFAAMLVPTLLGDEPIYDSLHARLLRQ
jgi:CIC family chloride channel protein